MKTKFFSIQLCLKAYNGCVEKKNIKAMQDIGLRITLEIRIWQEGRQEVISWTEHYDYPNAFTLIKIFRFSRVIAFET